MVASIQGREGGRFWALQHTKRFSKNSLTISLYPFNEAIMLVTYEGCSEAGEGCPRLKMSDEYQDEITDDTTSGEDSVKAGKEIDSQKISFSVTRILQPEARNTSYASESLVYSSIHFSPLVRGLSPPMLSVYDGVLRPIPLVRSHPATDEFLLRARLGEPSLDTRNLTHGMECLGSQQRRKKSWSRAVFTSLQRKGLELSFSDQKYITKPDRKQLAASLGLTDAQPETSCSACPDDARDAVPQGDDEHVLQN
ncbi:hypothetical protein HAZT_HAZT004105 [Hyalella azteca]|uniref:Homeobox domain-containing protein n=1 Tax=Hyalella azteca TaxID=294128 RepID=A0A6A0GPI3_HYAAZ|nr:hypothetical protein HAZT_HAZT004105 [Hyalella azteca]